VTTRPPRPMRPDCWRVVYLITYPNGKIYVSQDVTDSINYFGSANSTLVAADFPTREQRGKFTFCRTFFWKSKLATQSEVSAKERALILAHQANDLAIGYNRWPRFKPTLIAQPFVQRHRWL